MVLKRIKCVGGNPAQARSEWQFRIDTKPLIIILALCMYALQMTRTALNKSLLLAGAQTEKNSSHKKFD